MDNKINNNIIFIGVGIFLWLAISSFAFTFEWLFKDILVMFIPSLYVLWSKVTLGILIFSLLFLIGIRILKSSKKNSLTVFIYVILFFITSQIFQYLGVYIFNKFRPDGYIEEIGIYNNFINNNPMQLVYTTIYSCLTYVIIAIIIYKNKD